MQRQAVKQWRWMGLVATVLWAAGALAFPPVLVVQQLVEGDIVSAEDTTPPAAPVITEPANESYTNDNTPTIRGTAEPGSTVTVYWQYLLEPVGITTASASGDWEVTSVQLGDVRGRLRATATDAAGNVSPDSISVTITVDTVNPNTRVAIAPPRLTSSRSATFGIEDSGVYVMSYSLDGGPFIDFDIYFYLENLEDGTHTIVVISRDRAGNEDPTPSEYTWRVDNTPPETTIASAPQRYTSETSAAFTFSANEEVQGYLCVFDRVSESDTPVDCSSPSSYSNLAEGTHTLEVQAKDLLGFVDSTPATYTWTVDRTPPAAGEVTAPRNGELVAGRPEFRGTAEPGATVTVFIDGTRAGSTQVGDTGEWSWRAALALTDGAHTVKALVTDRAGNEGPLSAEERFISDGTAPNTPASAQPMSLYTRSGLDTPIIMFEVEPGATLRCSLNGQPYPACQPPVELRDLEPGYYRFEVVATDSVGNEESPGATWEWTHTAYVGSGNGLLAAVGCSAAGASPVLLPLAMLLAWPRRRAARSSARRAAGGLVALVAVLLALPARAQGIDLQRYRPGPGSQDMLGVYSPRVLHHLGMHAGLSLNYAHEPLVLRDSRSGSVAQSIIAGQATLEVLASIALMQHFELGLALPVSSQWGAESGEYGAFVPGALARAGLGDMRVVPKAVLPLGQLHLGVAVPLSLPTSGGQGLLGSGGVAVQPTLLAQWAPVEELQLLANVGWRAQSASQEVLLDLRAGSALSYALAAQWSPKGSPLFLRTSLQGAVESTGRVSTSQPLELLVSVGSVFPGNWLVQGGAGPGLTGSAGTPLFRGLASAAWSSPPSEGPPAPAEAGDKASE